MDKRIMDMTDAEVKAEIVDKLYSHEGHIKKTQDYLDKLKAGSLNAKAGIPVLLPKFRLSYPSLAQPKPTEYQGQDTGDKYSLQAVFEPDSVGKLLPFYRVVMALCTKRLGKFAQAAIVNVRTGASVIKANEDYIDYMESKGKDTTSARETYLEGGCYADFRRPAKYGAVTLVGPDKKPVDPETAAETFYPGCYCQAIVEVNTLKDKPFSRLVGVIKVAEGERLGGGISLDTSDFSDVNTEMPEASEGEDSDEATSMAAMFGDAQG